MTIRFAASIVLGLVATTSAFAAEPEAAPTPVAPVSVAATASTTATVRQPSADTRYCFRVERVGSRIAPKVCDTRTNLIARGYDIDAALAGR